MKFTQLPHFTIYPLLCFPPPSLLRNSRAKAYEVYGVPLLSCSSTAFKCWHFGYSTIKHWRGGGCGHGNMHNLVPAVPSIKSSNVHNERDDEQGGPKRNEIINPHFLNPNIGPSVTCWNHRHSGNTLETATVTLYLVIFL